MKSLTPVVVVQEIEPCARFWTERLGFQVTAEVPEGDKLGFVMLEKDGVQLMYQSWDSLKKDVPALATGEFKPAISLYFIVDDIREVRSEEHTSELQSQSNLVCRLLLEKKKKKKKKEYDDINK